MLMQREKCYLSVPISNSTFPIIQAISAWQNFMPWISFLAGLGGGLHCVGMCGGLVTSSCNNNQDIFYYQTGRLTGYFLLAFVASSFSFFLAFDNYPIELSVLVAMLMGGLFIYWGVQNLQQKKAEFPLPNFLAIFFSQLYQKLWHQFLGKKQKNIVFHRTFLIGFISIFLPCGLLYGVILSTISLTYRFEALVSIFFFWLGTLPSMIAAPSIIHYIVKPLKFYLPRIYGVGLILIGLLTISLRLYQIYDFKKSENLKNCHSVMIAPNTI